MVVVSRTGVGVEDEGPCPPDDVKTTATAPTLSHARFRQKRADQALGQPLRRRWYVVTNTKTM